MFRWYPKQGDTAKGLSTTREGKRSEDPVRTEPQGALCVDDDEMRRSQERSERNTGQCGRGNTKRVFPWKPREDCVSRGLLLYKRYSAGPCRSLGHKAFVSPIALMTGNSLLSASMTFPKFQWTDLNSCLLGKGGNERPRKNSQEQPWGKVLFPHQRIHTTVSSSYSADIEALSRWES